MDWLSVAALGIIWLAILVPVPRRGAPEANTVGAFPDLRKPMTIAHDDTQQPGRWVLAPRKGGRFLGPRERARRRARDRRRRIVITLLEAIAVTGIIGLFPPLRGMFMVTAVLSLLLVGYLGLVAYMLRDVSREPVTVRAARGGELPPIRILAAAAPVEYDDEPPRVRVAAR